MGKSAIVKQHKNLFGLKNILLIVFISITLAGCELFAPNLSPVISAVFVVGGVFFNLTMPICLFICVEMVHVELPHNMEAFLMLFVGVCAIVTIICDMNKLEVDKWFFVNIVTFTVIVVLSLLVGYNTTIMGGIKSLYVMLIAVALGFHFCGSNTKILEFTFLMSGLAVMVIVLYKKYTGTMEIEFDSETGRLTYAESVRVLANALAFPIYYAFIKYLRSIEEKRYIRDSYWIGIFLIGLTLLLFTVSRGAIVAVGITVIFVLLTMSKKINMSFLLFFMAFLVGIFYYIKTLDLNTEYMFNSLDTFTGRDQIWGFYLSKVFNGDVTNLLFGYGPGDAKRLAAGTAFSEAYEHSFFVSFLLCFGVVGFMFLMVFLYRIAKPLWKRDQKYDFGYFLLTIMLFLPFGTATKPLFYYLIGLCMAKSFTNNNEISIV